MGTVGLSFGSPTSGAGFDVSSTVSQIVANLQNVETPWKTQLATLESQDATISSLGTLFSNLSNDMSQLTDFQGILAQKTGSSSDTNVLELTAASSSATAGTHTIVVNSLAQTSSGYLAELSNAADTLSGSITVQAGSGTAQTITLNSSDDTLSGLASAINASDAGLTASVLTDASGSRLTLVSSTSGASGNIAVSNNSLTAAAANTLSYTGTAGTNAANSTGALSPVSSLSDALSGSIAIQVGNGTVQTVSVPQSAATLTGLANAINGTAGIGVTASIVTNSDGTSSLALTSQTAGSAGTLTINSSISDSITALNYNTAVTGSNASLNVDGVNLTSASNTVANLIPGVTFQLLSSSATPVQVVIGNDNTGVESTVNQFVSDYNSAISALNTQEGNTSSGTPEPLFGSPTLSLLQQQLLNGLNVQSPNGYLDSVSSTAGATLSGSLSIQVGSKTTETVVVGAAPGTPAANTIYTGSGVNTLAGIAAAINAAGIGVNAGVATSNGQSTLTLTSQTAGTNGALTVTSALTAATPTALSYADAGFTSTTPDSGTFGTVANASDTLSGSLTLQAGNGVVQNIALDSSDNTLSGLANAINTANIGVTAALNTNGTALTLTSGANGAAGALTVTSNIFDTTNTTSAALNYNSSSDINNLTSLGISVNNNGSLTFDATSLDSLLNSDYNGVVGFFQNANGWGENFATMLTNAGSSSSTGILALASSANSTTESTLNAELSKEQTFISTQQASLTAELNQANQILQELPSQLQGINELYSAITGFDQNLNG
ncbi:MAG TPA: flagellar filament capping protein FliD [Terracidiphilus sp.]|jgi:flagellar hook-associated protein 2